MASTKRITPVPIVDAAEFSAPCNLLVNPPPCRELRNLSPRNVSFILSTKFLLALPSFFNKSSISFSFFSLAFLALSIVLISSSTILPCSCANLFSSFENSLPNSELKLAATFSNASLRILPTSISEARKNCNWPESKDVAKFLSTCCKVSARLSIGPSSPRSTADLPSPLNSPILFLISD